MVERPKELVSLSRFDVAASDLFIVSSTVLTAEFKRCFIDPLSAVTQREKLEPEKRSTCTGAEAEASFWSEYISGNSGRQQRDAAGGKRRGHVDWETFKSTEIGADLLSILRCRTSHSHPIPLSGAHNFNSAKSPILGVHFARLAVDEGHRLVNSSSMHVQLAGLIRADKR